MFPITRSLKANAINAALCDAGLFATWKNTPCNTALCAPAVMSRHANRSSDIACTEHLWLAKDWRTPVGGPSCLFISLIQCRILPNDMISDSRGTEFRSGSAAQAALLLATHPTGCLPKDAVPQLHALSLKHNPVNEPLVCSNMSTLPRSRRACTMQFVNVRHWHTRQEQAHFLCCERCSELLQASPLRSIIHYAPTTRCRHSMTPVLSCAVYSFV